MNDDDLSELAYSAHEEAMSLGLSHELFLRYFKTIRTRTAGALPAEIEALLRIWKSHLGASREQCDESGRKLWDRIEAALAPTVQGCAQVSSTTQSDKYKAEPGRTCVACITPRVCERDSLCFHPNSPAARAVSTDGAASDRGGRRG